MAREKGKIKIILNNNKCRLVGDARIIHKLREKTRIKHPNAFWARGNRSWDGYVRYITESSNMFSTGLLEMMMGHLRDWKVKVSVVDNREVLPRVKKPKKIGNLTLRGIQFDSYNSVVDHEVFGIPFQRGILDEATNFGKSLIAAALYKTFKTQTLLLINNTEIFEQLLTELEELLPGKVGQVSRKKVDIKDFTICMVQTLGNRMKKYRQVLNAIRKTRVLLVDEADEVINRKDTKYIISNIHDCPVRVALTGTAFRGDRNDRLKHQNLLAFFGNVIHRTTNKQMVDAGYSANPHITIVHGRQSNEYKNYVEEYEKNIAANKKRNLKIWRIAYKQIKRGRGPVLILFRYKQHLRKLLKSLPEEYNLRIRYMHGDVKMGLRKAITQDFKEYKVDVLLASMIIRRGKNLPSMNTLINAAGGDSEATVIQIFGRLIRLNQKSKDAWLYDFYDRGRHLRKHSKHRIKFYKKEQFEVKENYKRLIKKFGN